MTTEMIKSRFCPSPTGEVHMGNMRTALFSALFAKSRDGEFLLRIEDTDLERSDEKYTEQLQQDLRWLGVEWQEGAGVGGERGPYWQSKRGDIYQTYYDQLIEQGLAYPCFCSEQQLAMVRKAQRGAGQPPRYTGTCRHLKPEEVQQKLQQGLTPTLRFKIPPGEMISFVDAVRGEQRFKSDDIGDFIIRKADGMPTFMYCNAIDDALMLVTHAMRGEDHLTNSPRQMMILKALGLPQLTYAHISLIVALDGSPLSKRHGSRSIRELREAGYLPKALLNYMARLGHYYEDNSLMSFDQLAAGFTLSALGKAPAKFDPVQMNHWQKEAVEQCDDETFWHWSGQSVQQLVPGESRDLFIETVRPNVTFPQDVQLWADVFFTQQHALEPEQLTILSEAGSEFFQVALKALPECGDDFKALSQVLKSELKVKGKGLFQPLRLATTFHGHGPEMSKVFKLLGAERIKQRFQHVLQSID